MKNNTFTLNIGKKPNGLGNDFSDETKSTGNQAKIDKWDYSKLTSFCAAKETIHRMKRQHRMGENICEACI